MKKEPNFKNNNSRYQFEIGSEGQTANKANPENDKLATGSKLMGAFTNPLPVDVDEEFASEFDPRQRKQEKAKERFQEDLQQNYNVELSEELLLNKKNK